MPDPTKEARVMQGDVAAAQEIAAWLDVDWQTLHESDQTALTNIVARHRAAEQERCAQIAERWIYATGERSGVAVNLASAIRSGDHHG